MRWTLRLAFVSAAVWLATTPAAHALEPSVVAQAVPPAPSVQPPASDPSKADVWLVIYSVLPDRTDEFEAIARRVRESMASSTSDVRKAQARALRVFRSALPNPAGRIVYFLQIPALTGDADRTGFDVLIDAVLPAEATALKTRLTATLDQSNPSGNALLYSINNEGMKE